MSVGARGWYPDPMGRYALRWWDGREWSSQVSRAPGTTEIDPLGLSLGSPTAGPTTPHTISQPLVTYGAPPLAPHGHLPGGVQTPGSGLPGGGAWTAPQQIAVVNVSKSPGLAVASLVLGVGAFFFSLIPLLGFLSIPFAICGVALGIAGAVRASKGYEGKGLSIAGIVTSVAALLVSCVYLFAIADAANDGINSDPADGFCNTERYWQDPDC